MSKFSKWCLWVWLVWASSVGAAPGILFGTEEFGPYNYTDPESGNIEGFSTDIVRALMREVGDQSSRIELFPWPRIYKMAQKHANVAVFSIVRTPEREPLFQWLPLFEREQGQLWKLRERRDLNITQRSDILRYRTVVSRNAADDQAMSQHYGLSPQQLVRVNMPKARYKLLFRHRVEFLVGTSLDLRWNMRQAGFDFSELEPAWPVPEVSFGYALAFSLQTDPQRVAQYREAMQRIKDKGIYQDIVQRWVR